MPDNRYKTGINFNGYICDCIFLEHTSFRNSNVKRRVYEYYMPWSRGRDVKGCLNTRLATSTN